MRRLSSKPHKGSRPPERTASDNLCKLLAETYPKQFAEWLFGVQAAKVKVLKTELSREPIRADSVILLSEGGEVFHAEFQTSMKSQVPVPLRLLDYYVGFKRQNQTRRVRQALVILKETGEVIPDKYEDERTYHGYDVIKMWEQEPQELFKREGLLPLATLCRTGSGEQLLRAVAAHIRRIRSREQRREAVSLSRVLAGLRYDRGLIYRILKEGAMLEESVIYQDILQKGLEQGVRQGVEQGERNVVIRLLTRRFGKIPAKARRQIERLSVEQIEQLCEALLDFKTKSELTHWLKQQASAR